MPFPKNSKTKTFYEHKRSFHLIFQAGNSAFLRLPLFFPVVGSVEVSGRIIDRLTKPQTGKFQALKIQGGSAPFFRNRFGWQAGAVFCFSPLSHSPPKYFTSWERTILSKLLTSRNFKFSTTNQKG